MANLALPSRMYQLLIKTAEPMVPKKLIPLWNHPAGIVQKRNLQILFANDIVYIVTKRVVTTE